jgi:hypothetical protein
MKTISTAALKMLKASHMKSIHFLIPILIMALWNMLTSGALITIAKSKMNLCYSIGSMLALTLLWQVRLRKTKVTFSPNLFYYLASYFPSDIILLSFVSGFNHFDCYQKEKQGRCFKHFNNSVKGHFSTCWDKGI